MKNRIFSLALASILFVGMTAPRAEAQTFSINEITDMVHEYCEAILKKAAECGVLAQIPNSKASDEKARECADLMYQYFWCLKADPHHH